VSKTESYDEYKIIFYSTSIFSVVFIILTILGILFYPASFALWGNHLSDTGNTSVNGISNLTSEILFALALDLLGISSIIFFTFSPRLFRGKAKMIAMIGSIFAIIAGFACIAVSVLPSNIDPFWHGVMFALVLGFTIPSFIFYTIAIFLRKKYPIEYGIIFLLTAVIILIYAVILLAFWNTPLEMNSQKIMIYSLVFCMMIEGIGAGNFAKKYGRGK